MKLCISLENFPLILALSIVLIYFEWYNSLIEMESMCLNFETVKYEKNKNSCNVSYHL